MIVNKYVKICRILRGSKFNAPRDHILLNLLRLWGDTQPMSEIPGVKPYASEDLTYMSYLKIEELLHLQELKSEPPHHDEMLFIIIHQAYELWFKLVLHELGKAGALMNEKKVLEAHHFVKRSVEVFKILVPQIQILETMTPADFLEFRSRLQPASGFQSVQFREIEYFCGLKDPLYLKYLEKVPNAKERLEKRLKDEDLPTIYLRLLQKLGFPIPKLDSSARLESDATAKGQVMAVLKELYQNPRKHMDLYLLTEALVDLDEQIGLWRHHHVKTVERIIGFKMGTGGSQGASYLRSTTSKQCFPFLWEVRSLL